MAKIIWTGTKTTRRGYERAKAPNILPIIPKKLSIWAKSLGFIKNIFKGAK
jgi:hypothetical protein